MKRNNRKEKEKFDLTKPLYNGKIGTSNRERTPAEIAGGP